MRRGRLRRTNGACFHVTQRCHDRQFLLRFKRDRQRYAARLRETVLRYGLEVLDYMITSNHVHLLLWAPGPEVISCSLQYLQGLTARDYNRRKGREGAFWSDRFHPVLIESGPHLSRCLFYIGMNMVRAGVAAHPAEWPWCGYDELTGRRHRYRILSMDRLLVCLNMTGGADPFRKWYEKTLYDLCQCSYLCREPLWTESVAVGSEQWIGGLAASFVVGDKRILSGEHFPTMEVSEGAASYGLQTNRRHSDPLLWPVRERETDNRGKPA